MKRPLFRLTTSSLALFFLCSIAYSQDPTLAAAAGRYVISAKAGHVNYVEGSVSVVRKQGRSGHLLRGDVLDIGDVVSTGQGGRAEILLNPGSFLRLGENAQFEFKTTSLDDLQLKIDRGSAILEVYAADEFQVAVETPKKSFTLIETGIYRIDVSDTGVPRLSVWRGRALADQDTTAYVKSGRTATVSPDGEATVAKFDRDDKDSFDIWSKGRGKELARLSSNLRNVNLRPTLLRSFLGRGWNLYGSFGLWVYDPFFGGYSFLPFGYGWSSPYGYGYNHCVYGYHLPPIVYNMPPPLPPATTPTTGPQQPTNFPTRNGGGPPVPPFIRMQGTMGGGRGDSSDSGGTSWDPRSNTSTPTYSPPPSAPPPSAPITLRDDRGKGKP
jgi:hypothetical protein